MFIWVFVVRSIKRTSMVLGLFKVGPGAGSEPTRIQRVQKCLEPHRHSLKVGWLKRQAINLTPPERVKAWGTPSLRPKDAGISRVMRVVSLPGTRVRQLTRSEAKLTRPTRRKESSEQTQCNVISLSETKLYERPAACMAEILQVVILSDNQLQYVALFSALFRLHI